MLLFLDPALYESITGFPQYTNYTAGSKDDKSNEAFIGTLDYIWLRKSGESNNVILTTHTVPLPDHELVEKYNKKYYCRNINFIFVGIAPCLQKFLRVITLL